MDRISKVLSFDESEYSSLAQKEIFMADLDLRPGPVDNDLRVLSFKDFLSELRQVSRKCNN